MSVNLIRDNFFTTLLDYCSIIQDESAEQARAIQETVKMAANQPASTYEKALGVIERIAKDILEKAPSAYGIVEPVIAEEENRLALLWSFSTTQGCAGDEQEILPRKKRKVYSVSMEAVLCMKPVMEAILPHLPNPLPLMRVSKAIRTTVLENLDKKSCLTIAVRGVWADGMNYLQLSPELQKDKGIAKIACLSILKKQPDRYSQFLSSLSEDVGLCVRDVELDVTLKKFENPHFFENLDSFKLLLTTYLHDQDIHRTGMQLNLIVTPSMIARLERESKTLDSLTPRCNCTIELRDGREKKACLRVDEFDFLRQLIDGKEKIDDEGAPSLDSTRWEAEKILVSVFNS